MRLLADESVDFPIYLFLKEKGYSIEHVALIRKGMYDNKVLQLAFKKKCILITVDKDFGELAFRNKQPSAGIILYRLSGMTNVQKAELIEEILRKRRKELNGNFTVLTKKQVRIRKLIF